MGKVFAFSLRPLSVFSLFAKQAMELFCEVTVTKPAWHATSSDMA